MMNVSLLERYMPCVGGGIWVDGHMQVHICTWVCMYVEARSWYQLCSSVHFHFIFLHLGFSLNQLNRTDRKPRDLPVSVSAVLGLQIHHCPWHGCWNLNRGSHACATTSQLTKVISLGTDTCFFMVLITQEILLVISQTSPICWNFFVMSPLVGRRVHSLCQKHLAAGESILKHKMPYIWMIKGEVWSLYLGKFSSKASGSIYFNIPSGDLERYLNP